MKKCKELPNGRKNRKQIQIKSKKKISKNLFIFQGYGAACNTTTKHSKNEYKSNECH